MPKDEPEMTANDVIEIVKLLKQNDIDIIIDGGWGVDALHKDVPNIRAILEARGYQDIPRDDTWECNFVLGDVQGHLFDSHSCMFDEAVNNVFGVEYPFDSWNGIGLINGYPVKCITPEWMVKFHTGYELDENDYQDIKLLCKRFGFEIPSEYDEFVRKDCKS